MQRISYRPESGEIWQDFSKRRDPSEGEEAALVSERRLEILPHAVDTHIVIQMLGPHPLSSRSRHLFVHVGNHLLDLKPVCLELADELAARICQRGGGDLRASGDRR
jgi:hypothetical protein